MFPRLLLASSNLAAPQLARAAGQLVHGLSRGAILTTAEIKLKERSREAILARETLSGLGVPQVEFFDLDARSAVELAAFDFLYIASGNPFYLLKRVRETEADSVLEELIAAGWPVIAVSAGAALLGRSLHPLRMFDSTTADLGWRDPEALGLVPFSVLPHANRWSSRLADYTSRLEQARRLTNSEIVEVPDGEAILVENDRMGWVAADAIIPPPVPMPAETTAFPGPVEHPAPLAQSA
jgi:dipeptidase E